MLCIQGKITDRGETENEKGKNYSQKKISSVLGLRPYGLSCGGSRTLDADIADRRFFAYFNNFSLTGLLIL